jgi:uncharacterized protein YndB with AHSA1/START domain
VDSAPLATPPGPRDANDTSTLRIERTLQAPAQAVFDAWTSEDVGGAVRVVMRDPPKDVEYGGGGRYTEIDPPRRLAFTWFWDGNDKRQLIEIDFKEVEGVTTVHFTHRDLWDARVGRRPRGA